MATQSLGDADVIECKSDVVHRAVTYLTTDKHISPQLLCSIGLVIGHQLPNSEQIVDGGTEQHYWWCISDNTLVPTARHPIKQMKTKAFMLMLVENITEWPQMPLSAPTGVPRVLKAALEGASPRKALWDRCPNHNVPSENFLALVMCASEAGAGFRWRTARR